MPLAQGIEIAELTKGQYDTVYNLLSLAIASLFFTGLYLVLSQQRVLPRYRNALVVSATVCFIATYHYVRIFDNFKESYITDAQGGNGVYKLTEVGFNEGYRYVDWFLTVPLLLVETIAVLALTRAAAKPLLVKLVIASGLMIALGYPGEITTDTGTRLLWGTLSTIPFIYILYVLFVEINSSLVRHALHAGDLEDDQAERGLGQDVGDGVTGLAQHECLRPVETENRHQVGDRVDAPQADQHDGQLAQCRADLRRLTFERLVDLHEQHVEDVEEGDRRQGAPDQARAGVGRDLTRVAQGDHEGRGEDELGQQRLGSRPGQRQHGDRLHQQQRDGQEPVDVAVALVESHLREREDTVAALRVGDVALLEVVEDPDVVIRGNEADGRGHDQGVAVAREYSLLGQQEVQPGEEQAGDREGQQVVDGLVLP